MKIKTILGYKLNIFLFFIVFLFRITAPYQIAFSNPIDSSENRSYIFFPKAIPEWKLIPYLGLSVAYLPKIIVEEEMNLSPLIEANVRYGLPYNFSALARVSTVYITNQFLIGLQWSHTFNRFSFSIGHSYAYWLGQYKQQAFNVIANGTINYPNITIGLDFDDFFVSLKTEAMISTFEKTYIGEATTGGNKRELIGWAFTYSLEQPFWKNIQITQGVRLYLTKFFYQSWIAFTKTQKFIVFPEFTIGFKL